MPNYRSLVLGGFYAKPDDKSLPVSIRSNNPGAVNGAAWERSMPGYVTEIKYDGKNNTTIFETPEYGVAVWYELMRRYHAAGARTVEGIIRKYGGGQDYSGYLDVVVGWTGFGRNKAIDLNDLDTLLIFAKAMFRYEAGRPTPVHDDQIMYGFHLAMGKKEPGPTLPATKSEGSGSLILGLMEAMAWPWVKKPGSPPQKAPAGSLAPAGDLVGRVYAAMLRKGYTVDEGPDVVNIAYVAGVSEDGVPNANRTNAFDDARVIFRVVDGKPILLGSWQATIETGKRYTENPIVIGGAARIAFNQFKAWQVGYHRGQYEALVQTGGPVTVYRDANEDYNREGDKTQTGYFGINQHHAYNAPKDDIGAHSAGCLVGRMIKGHEEFMAFVKSDKRYKANKGFVFSTAVLEAKDVK